MIHDIFAFTPEETQFDPTKIEINDELTEIIQQINVILTTEKGSVLGSPDFGVDLEKYLFQDVSHNSRYIESEINFQIKNFVSAAQTYEISSKVSFQRISNEDYMMVVDIYIDSKKVASVYI